jgi:hypothetical protein
LTEGNGEEKKDIRDGIEGEERRSGARERGRERERGRGWGRGGQREGERRRERASLVARFPG